MLYGSFGELPSESKSQRQANEHVVGFEVNKQDIAANCAKFFEKKQTCPFYLCLHGSKGQEYLLGFKNDSHPILLQEGQTITGPIPASNDVDLKLYMFVSDK